MMPTTATTWTEAQANFYRVRYDFWFNLFSDEYMAARNAALDVAQEGWRLVN